VKKERLQEAADPAEKERFSAGKFVGFAPTSKPALTIKTHVLFVLLSVSVAR
jgi:hypothetical protein